VGRLSASVCGCVRARKKGAGNGEVRRKFLRTKKKVLLMCASAFFHAEPLLRVRVCACARVRVCACACAIEDPREFVRVLCTRRHLVTAVRETRTREELKGEGSFDFVPVRDAYPH
jgi:hypothetical protein